MDDPWGSPWASADTPSNNDLPPSHTNAFLSPPPRAFFGSATGSPSQSPWSSSQDDNGSSAWATADSLDVPDAQGEWGAWEDSGAQGPRLSPRLSFSGKESPLPWPENAAASPVMLANSRSRTPSLYRHHSPDPWAFEPTLGSDTDTISRYPPASTASVTPTIETGPFTELPHTPQPTPEGRTAETLETKEPHITGRVPSHRIASVATETLTNHAGAINGSTHTSSKLDTGLSELPSRPSSTFSRDSHDILERQDSPITSIDEDRASQTHDTLRKSSGKVQQLVGVYDGLARAASTEPPLPDGHGTSRTRNPDPPAQDQDNTGDSGDMSSRETQVISLCDLPDSPLPSATSPTSDLSSTPKAELEDEWLAQSPRRGENMDRVVDPVLMPAHTQPAVQPSHIVHFDVNLALLDSLYPNIAQPPEDAFTEDTSVSEHIINDSFTTISERKAWYRISRYGSMRKHDSGDDENFHRITWPTSKVHNDTINIVRRWMEQDSYAGRATLGGVKRTGFFDWDSDAAPVELEKVFRRRESMEKRTRTTSISAPAYKAANPLLGVDKGMYRNSTGISLPKGTQNALPPSSLNISTASFGRGSGNRQDSPIDRLPEPGGQAQGAMESQHPPPSTVTHGVIHATPPEEDEDDDDWGEMVSSPQMSQFPPQTKVSTSPDPRASKDRVSVPVGSPSITSSESLPGSFTHSETPELQKSIGQLRPHDEYPSQQSHGLASLEASLSGYEVEPRRPASKPSVLSEVDGDDDQSIAAFETAAQHSSRPYIETNNTKPPKTKFEVSEQQSEDDIIVQRILQNLPDLSYMLR